MLRGNPKMTSPKGGGRGTKMAILVGFLDITGVTRGELGWRHLRMTLTQLLNSFPHHTKISLIIIGDLNFLSRSDFIDLSSESTLSTRCDVVNLITHRRKQNKSTKTNLCTIFLPFIYQSMINLTIIQECLTTGSCS